MTSIGESLLSPSMGELEEDFLSNPTLFNSLDDLVASAPLERPFKRSKPMLAPDPEGSFQEIQPETSLRRQRATPASALDVKKKRVTWTPPMIARLCELKGEGKTYEEIRERLKAEFEADVTTRSVQTVWQNNRPADLKKVRRVWTEEMKERLCELKASKRTAEEIKWILNREFDAHLTAEAVAAAWNQFGPSDVKSKRVVWTPEMRTKLCYLKAEGKKPKEIANILNKEFNVNLTATKVCDALRRPVPSSTLTTQSIQHWTEAMKRRACQLKSTGSSHKQVQEIVNAEFGTNVTVRAIMNVWRQEVPASLKEQHTEWTKEMTDRLRQLKAEKQAYAVITRILNAEFGVNFTFFAVKTQGGRLAALSGIDYRSEKEDE